MPMHVLLKRLSNNELIPVQLVSESPKEIIAIVNVKGKDVTSRFNPNAFEVVTGINNGSSNV